MNCGLMSETPEYYCHRREMNYRQRVSRKLTLPFFRSNLSGVQSISIMQMLYTWNNIMNRIHKHPKCYCEINVFQRANVVFKIQNYTSSQNIKIYFSFVRDLDRVLNKIIQYIRSFRVFTNAYNNTIPCYSL